MAKGKGIFRFSQDLGEKIDLLIQSGLFETRAEAIREAIRLLLREYGVPLRVQNPGKKRTVTVS